MRLWPIKKWGYAHIVLLIICVLSILFLYDYTESFETQENISAPKRLAVLFSGRIKGYTHVEEHLRDLRQRYNATFFVSLNKAANNDYIQRFRNTFNIEDGQINYEPVVVPEYIYNFDVEYPNAEGSKVDTLFSMLYHTNRAFSMIDKWEKEHNEKFDCVLFYRADIDSSESFPMVTPEENVVYIPEGGDFAIDFHNGNGGINGQIAYGTYDVMKKYSNIVGNLEKLSGEQKMIMHPETLLYKHLQNEGVKTARFPFVYKLHESRHAPLPEYDA